jgi:C4-dicarboxylate transporter/malic acid transport protein
MLWSMSIATKARQASPTRANGNRPEVPTARRLGRLAHFGPNWFASVMGTGIVANAAILLPVHSSALRLAALCFWVLAAAMLALCLAAGAAHWLRHGEHARGHARDPFMAQFYGAPPMAFLTVGAGTLLVGKNLIGPHAALLGDGVLWSIGTAGGLLSAFFIPYLMFTRQEISQEMTLASWLMPIVPPMVSAATGAALVVHLPAGQDRMAMLYGCYALFGMSLFVTLLVFAALWARLAYHGVGAAATVPTIWIGLGPLGQSITAASLLGAAATHALSTSDAHAERMLALLYGVPTWGFAMLWLAFAAAITLRTARRGLPFTLGWWSFTFPVGTVVTGTAELALYTHLHLLVWASCALYGLLLAGWLAAATRTAHGLIAGTLLAPALVPVAAPKR